MQIKVQTIYTARDERPERTWKKHAPMVCINESGWHTTKRRYHLELIADTNRRRVVGVKTEKLLEIEDNLRIHLASMAAVSRQNAPSITWAFVCELIEREILPSSIIRSRIKDFAPFHSGGNSAATRRLMRKRESVLRRAPVCPQPAD